MSKKLNSGSPAKRSVSEFAPVCYDAVTAGRAGRHAEDARGGSAARKMRKFVGIYKRMTEKSNKMTREEEMEEREKIIAEITELLKDADEEALRFIRSFLKAA